MANNYLQFVLLAVVAVGMVMIAGLRSDVEALKSYVANKYTAPVARDASENVRPVQIDTTLKEEYSLQDIQAQITKLGLTKLADGSYSAQGGTSGDLYYQCPTCGNRGNCCVHGALGFWSNNNNEGCNPPNQSGSAVGGLCQVSRVSSAAATEKTTATTTTPKVTSPQVESSGLLTQTLTQGMLSSTQVKTLQEMLVQLGYLTYLPTGNFLFSTYDAVVKFQTANGILPATGVVGPMTREKLNALCGFDSVSKKMVCKK